MVRGSNDTLLTGCKKGGISCPSQHSLSLSLTLLLSRFPSLSSNFFPPHPLLMTHRFRKCSSSLDIARTSTQSSTRPGHTSRLFQKEVKITGILGFILTAHTAHLMPHSYSTPVIVQLERIQSMSKTLCLPGEHSDPL